MLKTVFFYLTFWILLIFSVLFFIPYYFLRLAGTKNAIKQFVYIISNYWARCVLAINGISYTVYGKENIPEARAGLVVVSNHQGNFDIPIYISCLPFSVGIIAKHELKKMPILNVWMIALDCIFINVILIIIKKWMAISSSTPTTESTAAEAEAECISCNYIITGILVIS